MKKIFTVLAAVAFGALFMTSCSSSDDNNGVSPSNPGVATKPEATHTKDAKKVSFPEGSDVKETTFDEGGKYDVVLKPELRDQILGANATARALKETADDYVHMVGNYTVENGVYVLEYFGKVKVEITPDGQVRVTFTPNNVKETTVYDGQVEQPAVELKGLTSDICRNWEIVKTTFDYYEYYLSEGMQKNHFQGNFIKPDDAPSSLVYMKDWLKWNFNTEIDPDFYKKETIKDVSFNQYGKFTINFTRESSIGDWKWVDEANGKIKYEWEDAYMDNDFESGEAKVEITNGYLVLALSGREKVMQNKGVKYRIDVVFVLAEIK